MKKIEIVEAKQMPGGVHFYIAEVNEYENEGDSEWVRQHSRTPFTIPKWLDEEDHLAFIKAELEGYVIEAQTEKSVKNLKHLIGKEL